MTQSESDLHKHIARLEWAAKRLLDALGQPADNRDGDDSVIKALTRAAEKAAATKSWEF